MHQLRAARGSPVRALRLRGCQLAAERVTQRRPQLAGMRVIDAAQGREGVQLAAAHLRDVRLEHVGDVGEGGGVAVGARPVAAEQEDMRRTMGHTNPLLRWPCRLVSGAAARDRAARAASPATAACDARTTGGSVARHS